MNWIFDLIVLDDEVIEVRGRPSDFDKPAKNAGANGSFHSHRLHLLLHALACHNVIRQKSGLACLTSISDGFFCPRRCLWVKHSCPVNTFATVCQLRKTETPCIVKRPKLNVATKRWLFLYILANKIPRVDTSLRWILTLLVIKVSGTFLLMW